VQRGQQQARAFNCRNQLIEIIRYKATISFIQSSVYMCVCILKGTFDAVCNHVCKCSDTILQRRLSEANPTTASYNATGVYIYSKTNSMEHFIIVFI
jgi:hypothetical protein